MSTWIFMVTATALGGALLLWRAVSQTKHVSEEMLDRYSEMLADAREEKARKLEEELDDADEEPTEVS